MSEEKKPAAKKAAAPKAAKAAAPKAESKKAAKPAATGKKIKVTQTGSIIGRVKQQEQTLIGLGLNKRHRSRILVDSPEVRGMITAVKHLVKVEDAA
jgi:large subunit ribosomal protein L30